MTTRDELRDELQRCYGIPADAIDAQTLTLVDAITEERAESARALADEVRYHDEELAGLHAVAAELAEERDVLRKMLDHAREDLLDVQRGIRTVRELLDHEAAWRLA